MNNFIAKGINVSCRTIDGTAIIFDQNTKLLLKLDEVGSFIWDLVDGAKTIEQVSEICCQVFVGDKEEIFLSVKEFLHELHGKNVVVISAKPFGEDMVSVC